MYEIIFDELTQKNASIHRIGDRTFIPFDEQNTDYQKYLKWVAEGNTANTVNEAS